MSDREFPKRRTLHTPPAFLARERFSALERTGSVYQTPVDAEEIERRQLGLFNTNWKLALSRNEFYRWWRTTHGLPEVLTDMSELQHFPILTKAVIKDNEDLVFAESSLSKVYTTGGTTAEPTVFPRADFERAGQWADNYVGRVWWGIHPLDRSALIWGHSHLYGAGPGRLLRLADRRARDFLTRTVRFDGYRTDIESSRNYIKSILRFRPTHIVGYSSALARMARAADPGQQARLRQLGLKGLIATAETLSEHDEALIQRVFGAPVIVEYGAAELGVIGVSHPHDNRIRILWASHVVSADDRVGTVVTSLKPRQFPLVQYALEHVLHGCRRGPFGPVSDFERVAGRALDLFRISTLDGFVEISALQLTHMIKSLPAVEAVQFSRASGYRIGVHVRFGNGADLDQVRRHLIRQVERDYPRLDVGSIRVFDAPNQKHSRSGKHLVVVPSDERDW